MYKQPTDNVEGHAYVYEGGKKKLLKEVKNG